MRRIELNSTHFEVAFCCKAYEGAISFRNLMTAKDEIAILIVNHYKPTRGIGWWLLYYVEVIVRARLFMTIHEHA